MKNKNIDLQTFPENIYNLTVRQQVQNRHIKGTMEYKQYLEKLSLIGLKPSVLSPDVDVYELIQKYHKKGIYDPNKRDNSPREKVHTDTFVGWYWDMDTKQMTPTEWIKFVYSNKGVHIYPIKPET